MYERTTMAMNAIRDGVVDGVVDNLVYGCVQ